MAASVADFRIGASTIQPSLGRIVCNGSEVHVERRAIEVLVALAARPGDTISRDELIATVWKHPHVTDEALSRCISLLRQALGDDASRPRLIETIPKRGYRLAAPVEVDGQPAGNAAPDRSKTNLPLPLTRIIGRETELAEVRALLARERLVTLTGSGGVGKTRLAAEAGRQALADFADGVWQVELAPVSDPTVIPLVVATALGIELGRSSSPLEDLAQRIGRRTLLLIVDNCEHLSDAAGVLVRTLLGAAPRLRILATSRAALGFPGERVYRVPSLALPSPERIERDEILCAAAVQLFAERAKAADWHFNVDDTNAAAVANVCRRLDGIALAIEMAAARAPMLGVEQLDRLLDERFRVLTEGRRTALPRHQTLRATFDWSFGLLSIRERTVLARLGVFAGGFTLDAASFVASDDSIAPGDVACLIANLESCSLVVSETNANLERYRLLQTTRYYALERLSEAGETDEIEQRRALQLLELLRPTPRHLVNLSDSELSAIFLPEAANFRGALEWSLGQSRDPILGISLASAMGPLWLNLSLYGEGRKWMEAAAARVSPDIPTRELAALLLWQGALSVTLVGTADRGWLPDKVILDLERSASLHRQLGDDTGIGLALSCLGGCLAQVGRFDDAARALHESLPHLERSNMPKALAEYYCWSGYLKLMNREPASARPLYERALSLYRTAGSEGLVLYVLGALAEITWSVGDLDAALDRFSEIVPQLRGSFDDPTVGLFMTNLCGLHTQRGELDAALAAAREGLPRLEAAGLVWFLGDHLALRAALVGALDSAARLVGYSDAAYAANQAPRQANELQARNQVESLLASHLPPEEARRLREQGATMTQAEACRIALEA